MSEPIGVSSRVARLGRRVALGLLMILTPACSSESSPELSRALARAEEQPTDGRTGPQTQSTSPAIHLLTPSQQGLPAELDLLDRPWYGDFDAMAERRVIRVLTVFAKGIYFLDGPEQNGVSYDAVRMLKDDLNKRLGTETLRVHVVLIPVTRDRLIPALLPGYGDIAATNLTITPERLERVDFSDPLLTGVAELVVTGPASPPLRGFEDLAGRQIHVRESSSYFTSLGRLNESLIERQPTALLRRGWRRLHTPRPGNLLLY